MVGVIRKWDILAHPAVTIRCFGWKVFLKTLVANHQQTFLAVLTESHAFDARSTEVPEIVGRCIELERRAKRVYESLAQRFPDSEESVEEFFQTLADQEQEHADLLDVCRWLASREGWTSEHFDPWAHAVPHLERQMEEAESRLESLDSLCEALRLVIQIESSEVNHVYLGIVAATDSNFVRRLNVFREAVLSHIAYICERIPEFEPELAGVCRRLLESHLGTASEA